MNHDASVTPGGDHLSVDTKPTAATSEAANAASENRRWWLRLLIQPVMFFAVGILLLISLGMMQRLGVLTTTQRGPQRTDNSVSATRYVCPMMCTPPLSEPGRCPVCGMELVPMPTGSLDVDPQAVHISPVARRLANIQTATVVAADHLTRPIQAVGELNYDETRLKTISAYVDGRLEQLYADYTGVQVNKGDSLAYLYSPTLYSAQVEYLLARRNQGDATPRPGDRVSQANQQMYESARQRLAELGMTSAQIKELDDNGVASSRLNLIAPMQGTVIELQATEGAYVKEGQPIYRLADLSTLWLMLKLFPEDAAVVKYGQKVAAVAQSLPDQTLDGRVAFVAPDVEPNTRTVAVRVIIVNAENRLRVGDLVRATIEVPIDADINHLTYDPELASKWISPRHPQIVSDQPGKCPLCGIDLVPAKEYGFTGEADQSSAALVVPREAVLMAGTRSVVYVETVPGRFELRSVEVGPEIEDRIVIRRGLQAGEQVATRGNFLIDSQMQLAGKPSLIDASKFDQHAGNSSEVQAWQKQLSAADRALAERQRTCPVSGALLGSMGVPIRVDVRATPVFICCEACRSRLLADPAKYLEKFNDATPASDNEAKSRDIDIDGDHRNATSSESTQ
ncbi:MAG: efflux RND transporter periplasmic adaptor subunit [Planctomycetales bacterium]|nr:efflux RND transporter periplasmic adaptor subunit [Planctomycetales bacterium]